MYRILANADTLHPVPLCYRIMSKNALSESDLSLQRMAEFLGLEFLYGVGERPPSATFIRKIPIRFARRHCLLGLADEEETLPIVIYSTRRQWKNHPQP